jgi:protein-tyrosine phosphatase
MPSTLKRTFTIREFARMLDVIMGNGLADDSTNLMDQWRKVLAAAAAVRHQSLASAAGQDDVMDPYGKARGAYRKMENELMPALDSILRYAAN